MNNEALFRALFAIFLGVLLTVRIYGHKLGRSSGKKEQPREGKLKMLTQFFIGIGVNVLAVIYLVAPERLAWAQLALPDWARWLGVAGGFASVALLYWVHRTLGRHFSGLLQLESDHELVTTGPYRWVRHPMYTAFYLGAFSVLLLSANAALGGIWLMALTLIAGVRMSREEAMMIERFGDAYRAYMQRTTRLLPKLV